MDRHIILILLLIIVLILIISVICRTPTTSQTDRVVFDPELEPECEQDSDCNEGQVCDDGRCVEPPILDGPLCGGNDGTNPPLTSTPYQVPSLGAYPLNLTVMEGTYAIDWSTLEIEDIQSYTNSSFGSGSECSPFTDPGIPHAFNTNDSPLLAGPGVWDSDNKIVFTGAGGQAGITFTAEIIIDYDIGEYYVELTSSPDAAIVAPPGGGTGINWWIITYFSVADTAGNRSNTQYHIATVTV